MHRIIGLLIAMLALTSAQAAPLAFDRLIFPADGAPTSRDEKDFGLSLSRADGVTMITRSIPWKEKPEAFLEKFMESMRQGRTVAKKNPDPVASGKTRSGVTFVAQSRVLQNGGETVYALYYGFVLGEKMQAVILMSDNAARFKSIVAAWSPLLEGVTVKAEVAEDKKQSPTVIYEQTGPARDQVVSGVVQADSAKLTPVRFAISGAMSLGPSGLYDSDLILSARNQKGDIYLTESISGTYAGAARAQRVHKITDFGTPNATAISRESLMTLFKTAGEKVDMFFVNVDPMHTVQILPRGLVVGISLEDHNGFMTFDDALKNPAILARPSQLSKISFGWKTRNDGSTVRTTQKGNAWLFVMGPQDANGKDYSTSPFFMTRQPDGGWGATRVTPMLNGKPVPVANLHAFFKGGCVDAAEGFINDYEGFLYKLMPTGEMIPLGRLGFPTKGVGVTGPQVTANGDIWYALATSIDVSSLGKVDANGNYEHRQTWFSVGDRSRLIRLRPGKNGFELGEISVESIFSSISAKTGKKIESSGLWTVLHLLPDYKTGGLLVSDVRNRLLFSIKPED
ncbi:MAG: hypothetical protein K8S54_17550 [Spirochaetia bacterium]|nr:hypothetical protein [Spirochaetia bacterium]